jgi:hypothetical protein
MHVRASSPRSSTLDTHWTLEDSVDSRRRPSSAADVALRLHWIEFSFRRHDADYRATLVEQLFT